MVSTGALVLESLFDVYFRKWRSRAKKIAFRDYRKKCKIIDFQELFIWVVRENYFARFLGALGGSQELPGRPCQFLAVLGENL